MPFYINLLKTVITVFLLGVASYMDIKEREIDDRIWNIMFAVCFPITLYDIFSKSLYTNRIFITMYLMSIIIGVAFALALYKLNMMGGADAKAFIVLSLTEPPSFRLHDFIPSLSIFINSVLLSLTFMILIVLRNISLVVRGERIFEPYSNSSIEKAVAFITLTPVSKEEIKRKPYVYVIAERREGDKKRIEVGIKALSEVPDLDISTINSRLVWVSYLMPMIVYITIGYVTYKLAGCLLLYIIPLY